MVRCSIITSALGLLSLASAAPAKRAAPVVKLMPFGASIVEITCWRAYLYTKLQNVNLGNVDMVGSHKTPTGSCTLDGNTVPFDKDNEGHSGALVTNYAAQGSLPPWLAANTPDIVLMHVGSNDATANVTTAKVLAAYDTMLTQMRAANPKVTLILSKLIPIDPALFGASVSNLVTEYNNAMDAWVKKSTTTTSTVTLVDPNTGFNYTTMTREGEHPNEKGDVFMAERFFPVVRDAVIKKSATLKLL